MTSMRQLLIQVPRGQGEKVIDRAKAHEARNLAQVAATGVEGPIDLVIAYVSNARVEPLLAALQEISNLQVTLVPRGDLVLRPPPEEAPQQVLDVAMRSPIEVFLSGLQSVGSWRGFLGYALASAVVAWVGMFTNTVFLLTASMLIAPFAGPAMNMAIATARGDRELLARTAARYLASLAVAIVTAWLLSLLLGQRIATEQMVQVSFVSSVTVLLPLIAGAAGALHLIQSERSSLVSSAGIGVLVAASLAPPAAAVGMAAAIGEWDMVRSSVFLLLLQLVGINLAGAVVFRWSGLMPRGVRYRRGRRWLSWTAWSLTLLVLIGLLTWQFWTEPALQQASLTQRAAATIRQAVDDSNVAHVVDANVRFTRADIPGQNTLLAVVYVQRASQAKGTDQEVGHSLAEVIRSRLRQHDVHSTPLVHVIVLEP
jgi:uncharacterized hydrophobic protein (TIGR00271 family)